MVPVVVDYCSELFCFVIVTSSFLFARLCSLGVICIMLNQRVFVVQSYLAAQLHSRSTNGLSELKY